MFCDVNAVFYTFLCIFILLKWTGVKSLSLLPSLTESSQKIDYHFIASDFKEVTKQKILSGGVKWGKKLPFLGNYFTPPDFENSTKKWVSNTFFLLLEK